MRVPTPVAPTAVEHFGERIRASKFGPKMTRELYAYPNRKQKERLKRELVGEELWNDIAWCYRDEEHAEHSDAYLLVQRDRALRNFDLSMKYFESLDSDEFEASLENVLTKGRTFKPVQSLSDWDGIEGAYVMVFDGYRQFYVGKANDIRKRIKQHWTGRKFFERVIFGTLYDSILPMDELRALDTTRIYAARSTNPYAIEERAEKAADQRFCLNRMGGGSASPIMLMLNAINPRNRPTGAESVPLTWEDYERARSSIKELTAQEHGSNRANLIAELASLDMTIHSLKRDDGSMFMWSRRDAIARAAVCGELSVEEFAAFLEAMGEKIIWPEG